VLLLAASLALFGRPAGADPAPASPCNIGRPLVFGFLPIVSPVRLVQRFQPLVEYLSGGLQVPIRFETAPDFIEFARRTNEERHYDILFTAPHFFYQASHIAGYKMVAGVDSPGMQAIIVAPRESSINGVGDLVGRRLATVDPLALATLLARRHLREAGLDPDLDLVLVHTPTHNASLLSSYHGVTDASVLMMPPFQAASPEVRDSMKIIARTELSPHIPISVGPWVSDACAARMTSVLVSMRDAEAGRAVLESSQFRGFAGPQPEKYDQLEWAVGR